MTVKTATEGYINGDTNHIRQDVRLRRYPGEAAPMLYRFQNKAGDNISAIYVGGNEMVWTYTEDERQMISKWNHRSRSAAE